MKFGIYCIRDNVNGFMSPVVDSNDPSAVRNFAHAMADHGSIFYTHPSDFSLYQLGEFDSESGSITPLDVPKFIDSGSNVYISMFGGVDA